ncbi:rho GTPase-activating protein 20-like [Hylobates moloch]|uniref:rho GTPase-activating protein 20-like n=1 Tax=Hylobates moloch TaxID=81572 RepID=UPI002675750C|nr:rho GTPase-activating protein 20-like [Hylobates moloch]XP_058291792.1 rho GTPase-activating protein 20-like [Hylobates moloch]XP_058291793.1 rho GTPase-activating protein 20-like [Hylobates moloch]XP_058291794.1 rho GTPase-activating protein 20-like [Hylobates moloch]XP_058291795.1 rho GTPase-activating protein 20-like [Hylobates moloch]XP_058291796.1 rho GTPase-activating protein 20-like [Hylobates moloch]XP_058291797.1 rho GTPase-activating protein 20-like [Hylobates moloch]XP_05829179
MFVRMTSCLPLCWIRFPLSIKKSNAQRKLGNINSCRVLKEKLDSGDKVNLDSESVVMVASVFKVSTVQFLIENCLSIFGEDITSLLEKSSMTCDNSDASGTLKNSAGFNEKQSVGLPGVMRYA